MAGSKEAKATSNGVKAASNGAKAAGSKASRTAEEPRKHGGAGQGKPQAVGISGRQRLGAVVAAVAACAVPVVMYLRPFLDHLFECIDGQRGVVFSHPWTNKNGERCFDTRLTRLARYISMREWTAEDNTIDRFVASDAISEEDCRTYVELGSTLNKGFEPGGKAESESGYYSPESEFRQQEMAHVVRAAFGDPATRDKAVKLATTLRGILAKIRDYFGDDCIWFEFASATMREARKWEDGRATQEPLGNGTMSTRDLWELRLTGGHPMHSDSCMFDPWTLDCEFESSAFDNFRNFSGVMYLNTDEEPFEGGQYYIQDFNRWSPWLGPGFHYLFSYLYVRPKCGRFVSYRNYNDPDQPGSVGSKAIHGTLPITKGRRYAWGMWFTKTWSAHSHKLHTVLDEVLGPEENKCHGLYMWQTGPSTQLVACTAEGAPRVSFKHGEMSIKAGPSRTCDEVTLWSATDVRKVSGEVLGPYGGPAPGHDVPFSVRLRLDVEGSDPVLGAQINFAACFQGAEQRAEIYWVGRERLPHAEDLVGRDLVVSLARTEEDRDCYDHWLKYWQGDRFEVVFPDSGWTMDSVTVRHGGFTELNVRHLTDGGLSAARPPGAPRVASSGP